MNYTYSAGGIVVNQFGQILIVNQRGNSWSFPKGKIENTETEYDACIREIREESGLTDLNFIKKLGSYSRHRMGPENIEDKNELKTITLFYFRSNQLELQPTDPHNPEAKWIDIQEVAQFLTHPKDIAFFNSIKQSL